MEFAKVFKLIVDYFSMGLLDWLDKMVFGEEYLNRYKNGEKDDEYLHPSHRENREDARLYRIKLNQENQYNSKISKMLEEIEKKDTIARDKRGSIVALDSFPEIIKNEIVKETRLPLNRLKEYWHEVDHDYSLPGDEKIFCLTKLQEDHPKYRGSFVYSGWQGEYLENKEEKPFLRIWPYKS